MTYIAIDPIMGEVDLTLADPVGPGIFNPFNGGTGSGRSSFYLEELRGYDPVLGAGVFQYVKFAVAVTPGQIVQIASTLVAGSIVTTATPWTGGGNSGLKLGAVMGNVGAGQWGWVQVDGNAIVNVNASPTVGAPAYWQANGVISSTAVASKQAFGITFSTASAVTLGTGSSAVVLSATQAVAQLCRPEAQGAIT